MRGLRFIYVLTFLWFCSLQLGAQIELPAFQELQVSSGNWAGKFSFKTHCVTKDQDGFLWIGTEQGAFRYDGYELKAYRHIPDDSQSIASNYVFEILCDRNGDLWFGTRNGVSCLKKGESSFSSFLSYRAEGKVNYIEDLVQDQHGTLWFAGTQGLFSKKPGDSIRLIETLSQPVFCLTIHHNNLWMGVREGMHILDLSTYKHRFQKVSKEVFNGLMPDVLDILAWNDNLFYLASYAGVVQFDLSTTTFELLPIHKHPNFEPQQQVVGKVANLVMDLDRLGDELWVAYRFLGVTAYNPETKNNKAYTHNITDKHSLLSDRTYSLYTSNDGLIWISTFKGIQSFNPKRLMYNFVLKSGHLDKENFVSNLTITNDNHCWIGTAQGFYSSPSLGKPATKWIHGGSSANRLRTKDANVYVEDHHGNLWIGGNRQGLFVIGKDRTTGRRLNLGKSEEGWVIHQMEINPTDPSELWMASNAGLYCLNMDTKEWKPFLNTSEILSARQSFFCIDSKGLIYGQSNGQVYTYQPENGTLKIYDNLLPVGQTYGVELGQEGIIWVAHANGLLKVNLSENRISNLFDSLELVPQDVFGLYVDGSKLWFTTKRSINRLGTESMELEQFRVPPSSYQRFYKNAIVKHNNLMLFGGIDGITALNIHRIKHAPNGRKVKLIEAFAGESKLNLFENSHTFKATDNNIKVRFSSLDFTGIENRNYAYRLVGLADEWIETDLPEISFYQLPAGKYHFEVKTTGSEQVSRIDFEIQQVFWRTPLFYGIILVLILIVSLIFWRLYQAQLDQRQQREMAEQRMLYKSKFLANMSHEIRTPLNAIIGMNKLLGKTSLSSEQNRWVSAMDKSSEQLLRMVNDILDQERIERGIYNFEQSRFTFEEVLKNFSDTFTPKALAKGINLSIKVDPVVPSHLVGDPQRLLQVLNNLGSNAIKFTDSGKVSLAVNVKSISASTAHLIFTVSDTGRGIHPAKQNRIFESFEQARGVDRELEHGVGLGLSIAKQIVEQQGGQITVESKLNQGSIFSFILEFGLEEESNSEGNNAAPHTDQRGTKHFLLVEDMELNSMLAAELLKHNFSDLTLDFAENGEIAVEMVNSNNYDLVLMDVKMPVMDGYEATQILRNSYTKSELPIIAMTANAVKEQINKCISVGMNSVVTKPIDETELVRQINDVLQ